MQRESSTRKKREELTLEELQAKLQAADQRRRDIEARLKAKMAQETTKAETVRSANTSINESLDKSQTEEKEKQALVRKMGVWMCIERRTCVRVCVGVGVDGFLYT